MTFWLIIFSIFFIILFFVSQALTKNLYFFFYYLSKSKQASIQLITWFFLPGTVIHEVSHMIIAEVLGVRTGDFSFIPEIIDEDRIKAGSLKIAKTDPIRQTLVGLAPVFIGLIIIFSITNFFFKAIIQQPALLLNQDFKFYFAKALLLYLIFIVSNTMFSSKKDLESALFPLVFLLIIALAFWLGGFKFNLSFKIIGLFDNLIKSLSLGLGITVLIDLLVLGLTKLLNSVIIR